MDPDADEEVEDEEEDAGLEENRLEAPRNAVVVELAEPEPVLCTEGPEELSLDEETEVTLPDEADEAPEEDAPLVPAVLTTVIWRTVALPPVIVTLMPPRFPRSRGAISEEYFSAAVTPVTRRVSSTVPFATVAVRTATAPDFRADLSAEKEAVANRAKATARAAQTTIHQPRERSHEGGVLDSDGIRQTLKTGRGRNTSHSSWPDCSIC